MARMPYLDKICSEGQAARIAATLKRDGKRLVTISGSFDLLHPGHVDLLERAKKSGDALMVLLNSDASIKRYKGPFRPFIPERDRAIMLAAFTCVDYVVIFDDLTPVRMLGRIRPTIHCNGSDWGKGIVERDVVESNGGTVKILPLIEGYSSSVLAQRICTNAPREAKRAVFLDRDGVIIDNKDGYVYRPEDIDLLPGVARAIKTFSTLGYMVIVVTNQSGVGRGMFTLRDMERANRRVASLLRARGARVDRFYSCPHAPSDGCARRKPGTGLFEAAASDYGIALARSWFIGDSDTDVQAGRNANMQTIKIGSRVARSLKLEPHAYARDLSDAAAILKKQHI